MGIEIYFPIAKLTLSPLLLAGLGIMGGFMSGMLAIGSGIIMTPAIMMMGVPPLAAVATQLHNSIGTNFIGFLAYWRQRDVDMAFAWYIFCGGVAGAVAEISLLEWFRERGGSIYSKMAIMYIVVLGLLGGLMLIQNIRYALNPRPSSKYVTMRKWMIYFPWHRIFTRSRVEMSILVPVGVGFLTGLLTSTLGGGNSVFILPIVSYLIGRSSPVVSGTSLLAGSAISIVVTLAHAAASNSVGDLMMVWILIIGSFIGTQIGIRFRYVFPSHVHGIMAGAVILLISLIFARDLFKSGVNKSTSQTVDIIPHIPEKMSMLAQFILNFSINYPVLYGLSGIVSVLVIGFFLERLKRVLHLNVKYKN